MYMMFFPFGVSRAPAWFRRTSLSWPASVHAFVVALYRYVAVVAFGHCPQPASTIFGLAVLNPKACDSSQMSGRSATPTSFQVPPGGVQDSTVGWANRLPARLTSPPMAYTVLPRTAGVRYPRATFRFGPRLHRDPGAPIGLNDQVCADWSSTHPLAAKEFPPMTMALFDTTATPMAGRLTHPLGVVPGHGSVLMTAVVFVAG